MRKIYPEAAFEAGSADGDVLKRTLRWRNHLACGCAAQIRRSDSSRTRYAMTLRHDLARRDPEFDRKMQEVLLVYREVSLHADGAVHDKRPNPVYTVSVDEKPGVQALGLTAPDLPPVPGKAATLRRDDESVRHGTVSILAQL
jgi:hypothetical protein